jgi:hypothetical protein
MKPCRDCGVEPGEYHQYGCDVARCPRCGHQAISCGCIYEVCGIDPRDLEETHPEIWTGGPTEEMYEKWDAEWGSRRQVWTGLWPGTLECREYGFWSIWGPPWIRVEADTPGASEDLNRLYAECSWDVELQKMVLRKK